MKAEYRIMATVTGRHWYNVGDGMVYHNREEAQAAARKSMKLDRLHMAINVFVHHYALQRIGKDGIPALINLGTVAGPNADDLTA
jgi:hypothetical protein